MWEEIHGLWYSKLDESFTIRNPLGVNDNWTVRCLKTGGILCFQSKHCQYSHVIDPRGLPIGHKMELDSVTGMAVFIDTFSNRVLSTDPRYWDGVDSQIRKQWLTMDLCISLNQSISPSPTKPIIFPPLIQNFIDKDIHLKQFRVCYSPSKIQLVDTISTSAIHLSFSDNYSETIFICQKEIDLPIGAIIVGFDASLTRNGSTVSCVYCQAPLLGLIFKKLNINEIETQYPSSYLGGAKVDEVMLNEVNEVKLADDEVDDDEQHAIDVDDTDDSSSMEPSSPHHQPISPSPLFAAMKAACLTKWTKISACTTQDTISNMLDYREMRIRSIESQMCKVCWERMASVVIDDCGHLCLCQKCASLSFDFCPICRSSATKYWTIQI